MIMVAHLPKQEPEARIFQIQKFCRFFQIKAGLTR